MVPLSLSCKAPATISDAEAEFSSIKTYSFPFSKAPSFVAKYSSICPLLFLVNTISASSSKNSSTMLLAMSINPPPFPLKSSTRSSIPKLVSFVKAVVNSR